MDMHLMHWEKHEVLIVSPWLSNNGVNLFQKSIDLWPIYGAFIICIDLIWKGEVCAKFAYFLKVFFKLKHYDGCTKCNLQVSVSEQLPRSIVTMTFAFEFEFTLNKCGKPDSLKKSFLMNPFLTQWICSQSSYEVVLLH